MPFKDRQINKDNLAIVVDIKMQSAPMEDQSRMLVNTSLEVRKSLQEMENKIEKLNKKIEQFKAKATKKDKVMVRLKNWNNDLLAKIAKQKVKHDKRIQEYKDELEKLKKWVVELKAKTTKIEK